MRIFLTEVLPSYPHDFSMKDWIDLKSRITRSAKTLAAPIGPRNKEHKLRAASLLSSPNNTDWSDPNQRDLYCHHLQELRYLRELQILNETLYTRSEFVLRTDSWLPIEIPSSYFTRKDVITELKNSHGELVRGTSPILREAERFFLALYTPQQPYDKDAAQRLLLNKNSSLNRQTADILKKPITEDELTLALKSCHAHSAAGEDGLPFELWQGLGDIVTPYFQKALLRWNSPPPPSPFPILLGTLLFKKGDRKGLKNYRPLSIMNADLRWQVKAETLRLTIAFDKVISSNQTAFLPGRQIGDSIVAIILLCDFANQEFVKDLAVLSLDQEKAYDRVNRPFLFDSLRAYDFPEEVVARLQNYYSRPAIQYKINNYLTNFVNLHSGVLQGDPLACLLYLIVL
jgi:hypothetical protein